MKAMREYERRAEVRRRNLTRLKERREQAIAEGKSVKGLDAAIKKLKTHNPTIPDRT